jgi:hypothetical protein
MLCDDGALDYKGSIADIIIALNDENPEANLNGLAPQ